MKKIIDLNGNVIKTIEDELVERLGLNKGKIRFQRIEFDEQGIVNFIFKYPTSQDITGWQEHSYTIGIIKEEL